MQHDVSSIRERLSLGEDTHWQFKPFSVVRKDAFALSSCEALADELAAFANAEGGNMLCGVTVSGAVQGLTRHQMDSFERVMHNASRDSVKPPIEVNIFRWPIDGKGLVHVEVPKGYSKHSSPGGCFRRDGTSKRLLSNDEAMRLAQKRGQSRFGGFDKQPMPEVSFAALDESKWRPLLTQEDKANPEVALLKLGLLGKTEQDKTCATVAGVLMCASHPEEWLPQACITATCYAGIDRTSQRLTSHTIAGSLDEQIILSHAFALRNTRVAAIKIPGRVEIPEYSGRALFEALLNAVLHRDYSIRGCRIRLSIFSDRIEIGSPGSLPNCVTVDNMDSRQSTRNEYIAAALSRSAIREEPAAQYRRFFLERHGDGIPLLRRETLALCGIMPTYRLIDDSELTLTIPAADISLKPVRSSVIVKSNGSPVLGAQVLALFPNKEWVMEITDEEGRVVLDLYTTTLPMTVYAACEGFRPVLIDGWRPSEREMQIEMPPMPRGGSAILSEHSGKVPGLKGTLNPFEDTYGRSYVTTSMLEINDGARQPLDFIPGEELVLRDADGRSAYVRLIHMSGRTALVDYRTGNG